MNIDLKYISYLVKKNMKFKNKNQFYNLNKKLKKEDKTDLLTQVIYLYAEATKTMKTKFIYTDQQHTEDVKELTELREFKKKYERMNKSNNEKIKKIEILNEEIKNMKITISNLKYEINILNGTEKPCTLDEEILIDREDMDNYNPYEDTND